MTYRRVENLSLGSYYYLCHPVNLPTRKTREKPAELARIACRAVVGVRNSRQLLSANHRCRNLESKLAFLPYGIARQLESKILCAIHGQLKYDCTLQCLSRIN